jgi:release factor glutamine methyltransferase
MLRWAKPWLEERGVEDPRLDAEVLLSHSTGLDRVHLYANFDRPLSPTELASFKDLIKRRVADREPVAYLVGYKEFWGLRFEVDVRVLIPRPDTETLVELARHRARQLAGVPVRPDPLTSLDPDVLEGDPLDRSDVPAREEAAPAQPRALRIADVGTGSGIIAVALALELPFASIVATDLSPEALVVAASNIAAHEVGDRVETRCGDMLGPLDGAFDLIVSNPPYIASGVVPGLMPEVRSHEPELALTPGPTGLEALQALAACPAPLLAPGGYLICEIGHDQGESAPRVFLDAGGWVDVRVLKDRFSGQNRVIEARRAP